MTPRTTSTITRTALFAFTFAAMALTLAPTADSAAAQEPGSIPVMGPGSANYELAARFAPYRIGDLLHSTSVQPRWVGDTQKFWYQWENSGGTHYYLVDPERGTKTEIFDNDRIAAELTRITLDPWDAQHLPIRGIRFINEGTIQFEVTSSQDEVVEEDDEEEVEEDQEDEEQRAPRRPQTRRKVHHFEYDVATQTLRELEDYEEPRTHPFWASISPDTTWVVFSREFNLYMISYEDYERIREARHGKTGDEAEEAEDAVEVDEIQLTTDGEKDFSWGSQGRGANDEETEEEHKKRQPPGISWSHDGSYFAMTRSDRREVAHLWVVHAVGNTRPKLESYRYEMPGEENVTQVALHVFDMEAREMRQIEDDRWKDQRMGIFTDFSFPRGFDPNAIRQSRWLSDQSDELYFWRRSRNQHRVDVMRADPATGEVTVVIEERLNTYVEHTTPERLENGDLIWWSERDGWAHLYRYAPDGTVRNRLTEGPWHVDALMEVNEEDGYALVRGNAREEGEDPYYMHMYRVALDGSRTTLLNPGNFDHRSSASDGGLYFVDNYSRVNTTPASALFDASGRRIMDLETADMSALEAAGYQFPEIYSVKAGDGVTDIYGVMYKPYDFDPAKKYPIIAYVYPGPQTESVSKFFSLNSTEQALAQFGFIVVTIGNRGGHPDRSKWYHNYGYGNLRDYGLEDKKVGLEQLADRHPWIDIDRVGIYGHSGGGFMSTAAMLVYPEFFKVAVSSAGNHNNDVYNANWSEKHDGVKEVKDTAGVVTGFEYDIDRNSDLAANLKGHLLLTTGDVDNNVHHAGTFRMAQALIRANKRFDFFIFPGQRHGFGNMSNYWFWLRAEYFVKHLLGDDQWNVDILELLAEQPRG
ncbi:MAG: prolyl oligopeptidase family serine peptidase [Gemmatimonadetes bacterium]|nr:prolyl oligopeptidase family serine peptidase [Gemmatimonadota bacterium]MYD12835.1 prolyl oligopeptidase family serine peptidase [Gemmatimonadota bacterium]